MSAGRSMLRRSSTWSHHVVPPIPGSNKAPCEGEELDEDLALLPAGGKSSSSSQSLSPGWVALQAELGWEFLGFLFCSQHVFRGMVDGLLDCASPNIMKEFKVPAPQVGMYNMCVTLAWSVKPIMGLLSDSVPIMGYCRLPYMAIMWLFGMPVFLKLAVSQDRLSASGVVALLVCAKFCISTVDQLSEAVYASRLRMKPALGPSLVSFVWSGLTVADILACLIAGYVISYYSVWAIFKICVVLASFVIVPIAFNWAGEAYVNEAQVEARWNRLCKQKEVVFLSALVLMASFLMCGSGMMFSVRVNAVVSLWVVLLVLLWSSVSLNPTIAKVNAFSLLQTSITLSLSGAAFYFQRDSAVQFPDGPHFGMLFYTSVRPVIGGLVSLIGVFYYQKTAGSWTYRRMFVMGNMFQVVVRLSDTIFFARLNTYLGIPDSIFVLGSESLEGLLDTWLWMPTIALYSQLAPPGMEAIMYANLSSCHNLGNALCNNLGALLLQELGVSPNGSLHEQHKFDYLWVASLITAALALIPVVLCPFFIPDKMNNQRVLERDNMPVTEGSLWQRWRNGGNRESSRESHVADAGAGG